jgi:hypothetical protein
MPLLKAGGRRDSPTKAADVSSRIDLFASTFAAESDSNKSFHTVELLNSSTISRLHPAVPLIRYISTESDLPPLEIF